MRKKGKRVRAPPAPLPPDRFSTLPAELLHTIFDRADEEYLTQPLTKPICKTLLPYTTRLLYRAIAIRLPDHGRLEGRVLKLKGTLEKHPEIALQVRELDVERYCPAKGKKLHVDPKDFNRVLGTEQVLKPVLALVKNLKELRFSGGCESELQLLLSGEVTLANLVHLEHQRALLDPAVYQQLCQHFPKLSHFSLSLRPNHSSEGPHLANPRNLLLNNITRLSLGRGRWGDSNADPFLDLFLSFPNLVDLGIYHARIEKLLIFLATAPSHLESLTIAIGSGGNSNLGALGACLLRFARLSKLEIGNVTRTSFFDALPNLPLHTLIVNSDRPPKLIALQQLLEGPRKLMTLKRLHIDETEPAWRGSPVSPWAAVETFARIAEAQGVELTGTMLENALARREEDEAIREQAGWLVLGWECGF